MKEHPGDKPTEVVPTNDLSICFCEVEDCITTSETEAALAGFSGILEHAESQLIFSFNFWMKHTHFMLFPGVI